MDSMSGCTLEVEDAFGPRVASVCLGGFDFTLLFEESILTLLPFCLLLIAAPYRIYKLSREPVKVLQSWLYWAKLTAFSIYIVLQCTLLAQWAQPGILKTRATLATAILSLVGSAILLFLSHVEHQRSLRPSTLLGSYLALSVLLDLARIRTAWFVQSWGTIAPVLLASFCVKILILALELWEKRKLLKPQFSNSSRESTSGLANRGLFLWINSLFFRGFKGTFSVRALPTIDEALTAASEPTDLSEEWRLADKKSRHALLWTFFKHYKWTIFAGVPPKLAWVAFSFAQPFLVDRVLEFIDTPDSTNTNNVAYGLIGAYALVYGGIAISYAFYEHKTDRLIVKFRGSMVAMVFNKTLQLPENAVGDGSALTLFSQDVDRVALGLRQIHEVWSALIEAALAIWLLQRLLGVALVASALCIAAVLLAGLPLANLAGNAQGDWLEAIEERLAVTSKALASMKMVKMVGAVDAVSDAISHLREQEIKASGFFRIYTTLVITLSYASDSLAPVLGFGTYIILAEIRETETLTQGIAFSALTLFSLLDQPIAILIDALEDLKIIVNSFGRVQEHLMKFEQLDYRERLNRADLSSKETPSSIPAKATDNVLPGDAGLVEKPRSVVRLHQASAYWSSDAKPVLRELDFEVQRFDFTMVVGPVGSGKTTLLKLILGEVAQADGLVAVDFENAAYCSQTPWLNYGTIQENILGTSPWNGPRYRNVVFACGLDVDFEEFPDRDQTKVGARGSQLSGGQQKRVALARALFSDLPIIVLDDPLTGLDRKTEQTVLERVFSSTGLLKKSGRSVIMATNSAHHLSFADRILVLAGTGRLESQGIYEDLVERNEYVKRLRVQPQISKSPSTPVDTSDKIEEAFQEAGIPPEDNFEDSARSTGDLRVYLYYFKTAGWVTIGIYLLTAVAFVFSLVFPTIWLQWWTLANEEYGTQRVGYWLGVYAGLSGLAMVSTFTSSFVLLMVIVPITARRFHHKLLHTTTHAVTSVLTETDAGSILNRFSQDLELIDLDLPQVLETTVISAISAIAEGVLVFFGSGYVAAAIPGVIVILYLIQNFYLRTSRQLRLLEIEAKAPLFSLFIGAMSGLSSLRAYGWTSDYKVRNREILNDSQKPYYLLFTVQRWLTLVLNLLVACVSVLLVAIVTTVRGSNTALLGTALFNVVSFGSTLEQLITDWTELEQSIGAVSRIKSFVSSTAQEDDGEQHDAPPEIWPNHGEIELKNVSAAYDSAKVSVLKDINLRIRPGSKVAICGRTGSGKSTLVSTILRQLDLSSGQILIDGLDLAKLSHRDIRSRLNSIPQESFFLHGTVRLNLDPQTLVDSDDILVDALKAVGLWNIFEEHGGLDEEMSEDTLSHGQRQLFCLARAICKPGQIVILDEPTSSVDPDTDALVQRLVRERFRGRTIIAIVHKLQSILDFDEVILLDQGRIKEHGTPRDLLSDPESAFKALFDAFKENSVP